MQQAVAIFDQYSLFLWIALALAIVVVALWVNSVRSKTDQLMRQYEDLVQGAGEDMLSVLTCRVNKLDDANSRMASLGELVHQLEQEVRAGISKVGLVRFSPFDDTAGDQSFALALLDAEGTGIVISSLHARATTRLYAKSVNRGEPSHSLTVEEEEALNIALQGEETERRAKASLRFDRREV